MNSVKGFGAQHYSIRDGQAKVFALQEGLDSMPEDAEVYVVLEGSTLVHVIRAVRDVMLCFIVPGHNLAEVVSVQAYVCSETTPLTWVGGARLEYIQDDAQDMAEHLVTHGHCLSSTDHKELSSLFCLGQESSRWAMDHRVALAMANLDIPPNWNVLGSHMEEVTRDTQKFTDPGSMTSLWCWPASLWMVSTTYF
ncbi:A-kinase anchor protein 13 [Lampris incognitus]|uniref:A-kinase anchor protein 13 n=1 Tax=Lampris incognitus TaxID=2546036 RepID=UPI0024B56E1A|nr:A-kinase anchor protein 13 [Lampris incognitus]